MAATPSPEAAVQEMERRCRRASGKIEEAIKLVEEEDVDFDFDDPSVVRHAASIEAIVQEIKAGPLAVGTPPGGSSPPKNDEPPSGRHRKRLR